MQSLALVRSDAVLRFEVVQVAERRLNQGENALTRWSATLESIQACNNNNNKLPWTRACSSTSCGGTGGGAGAARSDVDDTLGDAVKRGELADASVGGAGCCACAQSSKSSRHVVSASESSYIIFARGSPRGSARTSATRSQSVSPLIRGPLPRQAQRAMRHDGRNAKCKVRCVRACQTVPFATLPTFCHAWSLSNL